MFQQEWSTSFSAVSYAVLIIKNVIFLTINSYDIYYNKFSKNSDRTYTIISIIIAADNWYIWIVKNYHKLCGGG